MRTWQFHGLTGEAEVWLKENCVEVVTNCCPNCKHPLSFGPEVLSTEQIDSFYGDGPHLRSIRTKDGKLVKEVIQAEPWSSGPCTFLCLELEDGTRIGEWSEEEIDHC